MGAVCVDAGDPPALFHHISAFAINILQPCGSNLASNSAVLNNLVQALCAILLGNVAYFLMSYHRLLPRHRPFEVDTGLVIDFFFCLALYVLIRRISAKK
ncbi:MAG: hypothetical protein WCC95_00930 [Candidatus Sulfotelmatobacter sp.]|jgi:hypothetical protein